MKTQTKYVIYARFSNENRIERMAEVSNKMEAEKFCNQFNHLAWLNNSPNRCFYEKVEEVRV